MASSLVSRLRTGRSRSQDSVHSCGRKITELNYDDRLRPRQSARLSSRSAIDGSLRAFIPDPTDLNAVDPGTPASGIAVDAVGNIYAADVGAHKLRNMSGCAKRLLGEVYLHQNLHRQGCLFYVSAMILPMSRISYPPIFLNSFRNFSDRRILSIVATSGLSQCSFLMTRS
jgi:hypothetical protein